MTTTDAPRLQRELDEAAQLADLIKLAHLAQTQLPGWSADVVCTEVRDGFEQRQVNLVHGPSGIRARIRIFPEHDRGLYILMFRPATEKHCPSCACDDRSFAYRLFDQTGGSPRRFFRNWTDGLSHLLAHANIEQNYSAESCSCRTLDSGEIPA